MSIEDAATTDVSLEAPEELEQPTSDTPDEPTPVSLADDALVEVIVDGQPQRLPWKDARTSIMLHKAFTQKTQSLAEERRQHAAEREQFQQQQQTVRQQLETLQRVMQDPSQLAPLLLAQAQQQSKARQPQPLTTANLPDLQKQFSAIVSESVQQQMAAFRAQQQAELFEKDLDSYTTELLKDHPVLSKLKGISDVIYGQVEKMGPKTISEAKEYIRMVVDEYRESVGGALTEEQKRAVAAKVKGTASIIPKGGAPVVPKAKKVTKLADLDDDVLAFLDQQDRADQ